MGTPQLSECLPAGCCGGVAYFGKCRRLFRLYTSNRESQKFSTNRPQQSKTLALFWGVKCGIENN